MEISPEELFNLIKNLDIKTVLATLATYKIVNFSEVRYANLKQFIIDKWNEGKFAFVPSKEEAIKLKQNFDSPHYKEISEIIPNYAELDLILTGLLIKEYQDTKRDVRVGEIKRSIMQRPNARHLIKIVNLPTTPFFSVINDFLKERKKQGYSIQQLEAEFNDVVEELEKNTLFVKNEHTVEYILKFVEQRFINKTKVFFLLGMKTAAIQVEKAVSNIEENKVFETNEYAYINKKTGSVTEKKIEVTIYRTQSAYIN